MKVRLALFCATLFGSMTSAAFGSATGLNTIPTTDLVPTHSWLVQLQNGNSAFSDSPTTFYQRPDFILQTQFNVDARLEAGIDFAQPLEATHNEFVGNIKWLVNSENDTMPNAAVGLLNLANHQTPDFYITFSKTLNYEEQQRERFKAHHRHNRKALGYRIHAGLFAGVDGTVEPFLGTDLQLTGNLVFQSDWINGTGNALTFGFTYSLSDQRTIFNPALLLSNSTHRLDGFFLNISHQFNL